MSDRWGQQLPASPSGGRCGWAHVSACTHTHTHTRGIEEGERGDGDRGRGRRKRTREMGAEREERIRKQSLPGAALTPCSFHVCLSGETPPSPPPPYSENR